MAQVQVGSGYQISHKGQTFDLGFLAFQFTDEQIADQVRVGTLSQAIADAVKEIRRTGRTTHPDVVAFPIGSGDQDWIGRLIQRQQSATTDTDKVVTALPEAATTIPGSDIPTTREGALRLQGDEALRARFGGEFGEVFGPSRQISQNVIAQFMSGLPLRLFSQDLGQSADPGSLRGGALTDQFRAFAGINPTTGVSTGISPADLVAQLQRIIGAGASSQLPDAFTPEQAFQASILPFLTSLNPRLRGGTQQRLLRGFRQEAATNPMDFEAGSGEDILRILQGFSGFGTVPGRGF